MSAPLPPPPATGQIDLAWFLANQDTIAAYMAAVYSLTNAQVVVTYQGKTLPARAVRVGGASTVIEVVVG